MSGGLMQLVAYGAQDVYLTGDPQITFWKGVYRRHTHFAIESIENTFNGAAVEGGTTSCTISRNADLLSSVHLNVIGEVHAVARAENDTTTAANTVLDVGTTLVKEVSIQIGGQTIDKQYGTWMQIWDELTLPEEKVTGYTAMAGLSLTGHVETYATSDNDTAAAALAEQVANPFTLHIPLKFWFCRHPGSAIPLVALQFHEVKLNFTFGTVSNWTTNSIRLYADYVYLDEEERQRFSQSAQEYLIEQVQYRDANLTASTTNTVDIAFNHPVKELMWKTNGTMGPGTKITFNGQDRASGRPSEYYSQLQPYQHHTRIPASTSNVFCYSFGLRPEDHQPSGTVNFSRIDNASMSIVTGTATTADIFAVNYNVLRVQSGLGGLAYSN